MTPSFLGVNFWKRKLRLNGKKFDRSYTTVHSVKEIFAIFVVKTPTSTVTLQCIGDVDDTWNDRIIHYSLSTAVDLYSAANDPQTANDPQIGPQMIPNRK